MSRGPGKLQRAILGALANNDYVILRDLLPDDYKHAELSALYRAARRLEKAGLVHIVRKRATWRKEYLAAESIEAFERRKAAMDSDVNPWQLLASRFGNSDRSRVSKIPHL